MLSNSPTSITQHFIRTHMEQRNLEEALSCLTEGVTWFGTGAFEVVRGKNQARQFLAEEIKAFPAGYTIAFSDMTQTMLTEDTGTVFGRVLVTDHMMGSQIDCRITATCVQWDGCFLIASLHMSLPTELQNDREYYPLTIAAKKVQQLKDSFFNETIPAGLFCCDIDKGFRLRYINDFFVRLLGYANKEEFLSETKGFFANCMSEGQDIAGIERDVQRMESNGHGTFTYRAKTKSGDEIWLREYTHKYENDGVFGLLCFCMDISDIIQLENQLKAQKSQLEFANAEIQTIVSNIPGGVHRCPLFGRIHVNYVSHGFEEMSGYTQSEIHEMFNDKYTLLLIEEDRSIFSDAIRQLSNEPADKHLEYRMRRKDGTVIRVVDHFRSVRMEDGKMWGFGVATDVTSQYETLEQLQLLTDSIPGGLAVYEYSLNGFKNLYFSDGVCEMIGYTRDEYRQMTKDNFLDMIFEEDLPLLRDKIHQVIVGSSAIDCVYRLRTKSGGYRWMNLRGTVADRRDDMIRVNAVLFDITDAKESEEKLRIRDEEYSLAIKQSGKRVYRYTLSDRSLYMLQKSIDLFELSSYEKNVPARIVELGFIAPESVNDCMAFYDAIFRGVKSGCTILRCKLKNGGFGWCSAHF
ncbi:MAG: PAS domain-containing protein, partial [Anaerovorax sp.]